LDAIVSIASTEPPPPTQKSIDFVAELESDTVLKNNFWTRLAEFLEHEANAKEQAAIFGRISGERALEASEQAPDAANRSAIGIAVWIQETAFVFDYCDVLANRLKVFIEHCNLEAKCECLMALLELGTFHNRWYVERKFYRLSGPRMDPMFAKRFAEQLRIGGKEICHKVDRLEQPISVNRNSFHPISVVALAELCK
jgi:hypothetical protein